jgi:hypothetical protein
MELVQRPYSIIPCLSGPTRFFIIFDGGFWGTREELYEDDGRGIQGTGKIRPVTLRRSIEG